ncbi:MAG: hypothetical protein LC643_01720 [Bacteroidales bacterium]|nr:hypothetical protein [Bacteroidales bacterium]
MHCFIGEGHSHDDFHYTVTGILRMSGNVTDNLILTPTKSVWMVHSDQHEHEYGHVHRPEAVTLEEVQNKLAHDEDLSEEEAHLYNESKGELVVKKTEAASAITALLVFYKTPGRQ